MSWKSSLSNTVKEIRLHFCQTSPSSAGIRQYLTENYASIKKDNPSLPILIREVNGIQARAFARFDKGVEKQIKLDNVAAKDVEQVLQQLINKN